MTLTLGGQQQMVAELVQFAKLCMPPHATHRCGATVARSTVFCLLVWLCMPCRQSLRRRRVVGTAVTRLTQITWHVSASENCSVLLVKMLSDTSRVRALTGMSTTVGEAEVRTCWHQRSRIVNGP